MKSFRRKLGFILLTLGFLIGIERLSHFLTEDFSHSTITSNLPYNHEWNTSILKEDRNEAKKALNQPYTYLNCGSQSYVFISEDKKYVLKFFKHKRWRINSFLNALPLPLYLDGKRQQWKQRKKHGAYSALRSCITSYTEFKEETGIVFFHLNKTPFPQTIILKDRIGFKHHINLTDIDFVLQKKATLTNEYLLSLKAKGETKKAKAALSSLFSMMIKRTKKGYRDKDPNPILNFGFIGQKAVEIDIGGFYRAEQMNFEPFHPDEMKAVEKKLFYWLEKQYPELLPYAKQELAKLK